MTSRTTIALEVNGERVTVEVTPRTHLADVLREQLLLTGTHLGCEHGVCGACTVELDGEIVRSCITFAVACDGAVVRTIEGFDHDPTMERMRRAFTEEHALQCGYCTPGMLIAARDLVRRKQAGHVLDTRTEMSGNLCRCTGYVGIVNAIERVAADIDAPPVTSPARDWLGPAPGPRASTTEDAASAPATIERSPGRVAGKAATPADLRRRPVRVEVGEITVEDGVTRFTESFVLEHPPATVWTVMRDVETVARCMPGLVLDGPPDATGRVSGRMEVKLGPITARFAGEGTAAPDEPARAMAIDARGADTRSGSLASGRIDYGLAPVAAGESEHTRIDCTIAFTLQGPLAQFSRSDLVRDLVARIGEAFAQNIDLALRAPEGERITAAPLSGFAIALDIVKARLRRLVAKLLGRG